MTWYVASAIVAVRPVRDTNHRWRAYENCYLVEAESLESACAIAQGLAREACVEDPTLEVDGVPASLELLGIRRVTTIANPPHLDLDQDPPSTGTELTYAEFEVGSHSDLIKLAAGESVTVCYLAGVQSPV
ncbi:MAG: DUF4288 domain-containing protein [Pseudomarimonas sp.]